MQEYVRSCTQLQVQPKLAVFAQLQSICMRAHPSATLCLDAPNPATLPCLLASLPQLVELRISGVDLSEYFD